MPTHARELARPGKHPVRRSTALASAPSAEAATAPEAAGRLTPASILGMQGSAGNSAVVRKLRREGLISTGRLAENLQQARESRADRLRAGEPVRFRLPKGAEISAMLKAGKIPEDKLKAAIQSALERMAKESLLSTADSVPDIMKKIFPAAGTFDEKAFEKVVDVKDRAKIYEKVAEAETRVNSTDKPKLEAAMDDAADLIDQSMADSAGLVEVFGKQAKLAKDVYAQAKRMVLHVKANMDTAVDTDYNRDDEQVGLGGYALFGARHIHLEHSVAEVADKDEAAMTIIHECCHLANRFVDDRGYYQPDSGFEAMPEVLKVANAAHYEELPRRIRGISLFPGPFVPGKTSAGKATFADKVKRDGNEYLRMAWDKAVDVFTFIRGIRKDIEGGSNASFTAGKTRILELSRLAHLTIHEQATPDTVQMVDVILAEGIARGTVFIRDAADAQTVPASPDPGKTQKDHVEQFVNDCIKSYGKLTGSFAGDKALMDWLVKEYRKPL